MLSLKVLAILSNFAPFSLVSVKSEPNRIAAVKFTPDYKKRKSGLRESGLL